MRAAGLERDDEAKSVKYKPGSTFLTQRLHTRNQATQSFQVINVFLAHDTTIWCQETQMIQERNGSLNKDEAENKLLLTHDECASAAF